MRKQERKGVWAKPSEDESSSDSEGSAQSDDMGTGPFPVQYESTALVPLGKNHIRMDRPTDGSLSTHRPLKLQKHCQGPEHEKLLKVIEAAADLQVGGLPDQGEVSSSESAPSWSNSAQGVSVEMKCRNCNKQKPKSELHIDLDDPSLKWQEDLNLKCMQYRFEFEVYAV